MRLREIYNTLGDTVTYRKQEFRQTYYSLEVYSTRKFPTRSKEIIWENDKGDCIWIDDNHISYTLENGDVVSEMQMSGDKRMFEWYRKTQAA
jgi:hypothetical protein